MRRHFWCLFLILLAGSPLTHGQESCGTSLWLQQLEAARPGIRADMEAIEQSTSAWIQQHAEGQASRSIVTIPVVVHVLYNTPEQNISDEQILSQIQILNEDYRRQNADRVKTPAIFLDVAADCGIEFVLAKQDPQGNATNGITRTATQALVFQMGNFMKRPETGGKSAWDTQKYLNIWVCNLNPGLLGYASVPGSELAAYDGVVLTYKAFGKGGTTVSPYNLGRTATHEVGHWLNLQHIWGDNDGADPCSGTDNVPDTPNQAERNEGCPSFPHPSCGNISDMYMNYMDYVRDSCMNLFTIGQKNRMIAALNGPRAGILSSKGAQEPEFRPECDTVTNANNPDGLVFYRIEEFTTGDGFLIGHNSLRDKAFAEYIGSSGQHSVSRLMFDFARADFGTPDDSIRVFIRAADNDGPGAELGSVKLAISTIAENIENFEFTQAVFSPGITVNGSFYAGFEVDYLAGDSVGIFSTQYTEPGTGNAWLMDSTGAWASFDEIYELGLSMGVYAELCSTVSMNEPEYPQTDILLFPNPADEMLNVLSTSQPVSAWQIYSSDGRLVMHGNAASGKQVSIQTSDLSNGLYLFRILTVQGIQSSKLIIQHPSACH